MEKGLYKNKLIRCNYSRITYLFFAIFLFIVINSVVLSQFTWTRVLGRPLLNDVSWSCLTLRDGNFLAVGYRSVISVNTGNPIPQTYLVKFAKNGNVLWEKIYGDSLIPNESQGVVEDSVGNLYIASMWNKPRLIKTDQNGNVLWYKNFDLPIVEFGSIRLIDNFRKVLISGINDSNTLFAASLTKVDTSGNLIWTKSFRDSLEHSFPYDAYLVTNDAYYIAGDRLGTISNRYYFMKLDTSGIVIWKRITPLNSLILSMCKSTENTFIATGQSNFGLFCMRFDKNGDTLWFKSFVIDSLARGTCIVNASNNRYAISTSGYQGVGKIAVIDSSGNLLLNKLHYYGSNDVISYHGIDVATDSGFIISGYIEPNDQGTVDFLVVKTDKNGNTTPIGIISQTSIIKEYELDLSVYPNPFNSQSVLKLNLSNNGNILLKLYNVAGQEIAVLSEGFFNKGTYKIQFSPDKYMLASGVYFLTAETGSGKNFIQISKKIIYLK